MRLKSFEFYIYIYAPEGCQHSSLIYNPEKAAFVLQGPLLFDRCFRASRRVEE